MDISRGKARVVSVKFTPVDLCHSLCSGELAQTQVSPSRGVLPHDRHIPIIGCTLLHHACQTRLSTAPPGVAGKLFRVEHVIFSLPPFDSLSAFQHFDFQLCQGNTLTSYYY
jgi:hypothetical protein